MESKHSRIVIDTNLWVSMAIGSQNLSLQMLRIISDSEIEIFTSNELLVELTETLTKPKLQKYLSYNRTKNLFDIILERTKLIEVKNKQQLCRDPKDDFIINLALESESNFIVSGDSDLLVLNPINEINILTISEFLNRFVI
jgi:uncharacterized protein